MRTRRHVALGLVLAALATPAHAEDPLDVEGIRSRMRVFTDRKGHVLVLAPKARKRGDTVGVDALYGTTKVVHRVPLTSATESDATFDEQGIVAGAKWELVQQGQTGSVTLSGTQVIAKCDRREGTFHEVPAAEAAKLLAKTKFERALWRRFPFLLARDDGTTYFYIDLPTESESRTEYALYTGKRGAMRRLKILDLASDSAGFVLITQVGTMRGTMPRARGEPWITTWTPRKPRSTPVQLITVPLGGATMELIYGDLGVYTGVRFGTPCDDV